MKSQLFRILALAVILAFSAVVANATDISVSAFQVPSINWGGSTATLRIYSDDAWTDSLGIPRIAGSTAQALSSFQTVSCTLSGTTLTVASFTIPSTTNALVNNKVRLTARFYDSKGTARDFLFTSWFIPFSPTSTTWQVLAQVNNAPVRPQPSIFLDAAGVQAIVSAQVPCLTSSDVAKGCTFLSTPPAVAASPTALSVTDPRVSLTYNPMGSPFNASCDGTTVDTTAFTNLLTVISATKSKIKLPAGRQCLVGNVTIPANVTIDFTEGGAFKGVNGTTLTFVGTPQADARQIFFNYLSGGATVSFSGNRSIPVFYPDWWGPAKDGVTNASPAFAAFLAAIPDGSTGWVTQGSYLFSTGFSLSGRKSVALISGVDGRNDSAFVPQFIWNGTGGTLFDLNICQLMRIEGFRFTLAAGKTVDKFINIDGTAGAQISTANTVRYNTFNAASQSNASAKLVSISAVATTNNENMDVSYNAFFVSTGTRATAAGVAIYNGNNPNAKHQKFNFNTISNAAFGIRNANGSFGTDHFGGGQNGVDIQIDHNTEGIPITNLEPEDSAKGLVVASAGDGPVRCDSCRFSNGSQTNTGGFLEVDSRVLITNSKFDFDPPVGGILIKDAGTGNLRLIIEDSEFPGVTAAQVGITQWTVDLGSVYSIRPTEGITGIEQNDISSFRPRYTQTVIAGVLDPFLIEQVWPTGTADVQNGIRLNVTDVGTSAAGSNLLDLQVAGTSKFRINKSGQVTSSLATGNAPLVVASTTKVSNLNADQLDGQDFADPGAIGAGAPGAATFTTVAANVSLAINGGTALTTTNRTGTGNLVLDTKPTIGLLVQTEGAVLSVSSNTIAPTNTIHHVGAGLIKTITVPASFTSGTIFLIPDAAFTYDNTGNILLPAGGGTATINRVMTFTWSSSSSKWIPSY